MGILKVTGTLGVQQFWPEGGSDADTTKIIVKPTSFKFQPTPSDSFRVTRAFEGARVRGRITRAPIDAQGRMTVRVQGVDAPELHNEPGHLPRNSDATDAERERFRRLNKKYRQNMAETAADALARMLQEGGGDSLGCTVTTNVETPGDVFDTYARFVGDVEVVVGTKRVVINHWLLSEGWALPSFYSSMTPEEIVMLRGLAREGRQKQNRVWDYLRGRVGRFNFKLLYRGPGAEFTPGDDAGPFIQPKLYRRLCAWACQRKAAVFTGTFKKYLQGTRDACFRTEEFLEQGPTSSTTYMMHEFLEAGRFTAESDELVFNESASRLIGPDNTPVTNWF